ncbi:hypothetical protein CONLIGDRAFT_685237 [Coniochaeta ligniaria NRRL 30616]|uniref:Ecp2 effector protein domain-containing protein n=1 Tax=Coniochaeta ligniaria NRRL 30616 TaxID=1408157 RepID=A0A1J7ICF6_9PEZI|nr:hypothetical protein CONLIGDRAFT_685237 [Coniochaeta ligniaria NRRL 30616]
MHISLTALSTSLLLSHLTSASVASEETCYSSEGGSLLCYRSPSGEPQTVDVANVSYIAAYLRRYGRTNPCKPGFYTMLAQDTADCAEWTLYTRGSALALAKHVDPAVNTSVLFDDMATTIDGGGDTATDAQKRAAIIGCLSDDGSLGVVVNATNPAYVTEEYVASGYQPDPTAIIMHAPTGIVGIVAGLVLLAAPASARTWAGGVNMDEACQEQYANPSEQAIRSGNGAYDWWCYDPNGSGHGGAINVDEYCKVTYHGNAYADPQGGGAFD